MGKLQLGSTQVSQVIVPQWIGQSKAYYLFPRKFEGVSFSTMEVTGITGTRI
jgi:hypothetical protein